MLAALPDIEGEGHDPRCDRVVETRIVFPVPAATTSTKGMRLASVHPETLSFWNRWINSNLWGRKARRFRISCSARHCNPKRPSPLEPIMRQERTIQATIFEVF